MIGFRPTNFIIVNQGNQNISGTKQELIIYQKFLIELGYTIDIENNVYLYKDLGAFKNNINESFNSIEELEDYSKNSKDKIYSGIYEYMNNGYEFVIGPPLPNSNKEFKGEGLYCINYLKDVKKNKVYY